MNDTLRVLSSGVDVRVSDEELMALIPRLRRADAPTTKLLASPFEDLFILRAAVGDFEDIIRRLARGQNVNALHSVSAVDDSYWLLPPSIFVLLQSICEVHISFISNKTILF